MPAYGLGTSNHINTETGLPVRQVLASNKEIRFIRSVCLSAILEYFNINNCIKIRNCCHNYVLQAIIDWKNFLYHKRMRCLFALSYIKNTAMKRVYFVSVYWFVGEGSYQKPCRVAKQRWCIFSINGILGHLI